LLVVDDKPYNRLVLENLLIPLGFEVTSVANGRQAVDILPELRPDLILMDLVMPVMTGFTAIQKIRQMPEAYARRVPIIAVSASAYDEDKQKSLSVGCQAFLPKPIETKVLLNLLQTQLQLDWIYKKVAPKIPESDETTTILPPPPDELATLYELAQLGNMKRLKAQAAQLANRNAKYAPFAHRLRQLAQGFEDRKILAFIKRFMEQHNESGT
jgi:CheY-like chemotaxis protein